MTHHFDYQPARPGSPELQQVLSAAEAMRAALVAAFPDPADHMTYGFTAAAMVAGMLYGTAIAVGIESGTRARTRRAAKTVETNFHAGISAALRRASRDAAQEGQRP